jgi:NADH dehydrogenase FAD-containing subunit
VSAPGALVDRTRHHLVQPLLDQVASGMRSGGQILVPLAPPAGAHRTAAS